MDCSPPGFSVCGISRQEYWSGQSFPSPGDLPDPGIKLQSPALQVDSLMTQVVKNLPAMLETKVQSRGGEDPLEKEVTTQSSILALENSKDRGALWATVHGVAKSHIRLSTHTEG